MVNAEKRDMSFSTKFDILFQIDEDFIFPSAVP